MGFPGTWMTETESVVYRVVPKCACSTIGQILYYSDHGTFFDGGGTRFDFEVISNQNGGVGGAWVNGARHRESRIEMRYAGNQMRINNLDTGQSGAFICN